MSLKEQADIMLGAGTLLLSLLATVLGYMAGQRSAKVKRTEAKMQYFRGKLGASCRQLLAYNAIEKGLCEMIERHGGENAVTIKKAMRQEYASNTLLWPPSRVTDLLGEIHHSELKDDHE